MRLKRSFGLLLVLIFSLSMISGIVRSAPTPSILASTTATGVSVQGSSWTANTVVILYFDVVDANHKVAQPTTDYGGSFTVNFPLGGTTQGTHTITAVQGAKQATAAFTVGAVSPPDDRLLNPVNSILSLMQTGISSDLQQIKTKLNTVDGEIQAVENKLDAGGSFYNFVNGWFSNIDNRISNVENKLNDIGQKVDASNAEEMIWCASGEFLTEENTNGHDETLISVHTSPTSTFTITFMAGLEDKDDWVRVYAFVHGSTYGSIPIAEIEGSMWGFVREIRTVTVAADELLVMFYNEDGSTDITWAATAESCQGAVVTQQYIRRSS